MEGGPQIREAHEWEREEGKFKLEDPVDTGWTPRGEICRFSKS